jgi:hypothetical protein
MEPMHHLLWSPLCTLWPALRGDCTLFRARLASWAVVIAITIPIPIPIPRRRPREIALLFVAGWTDSGWPALPIPIPASYGCLPQSRPILSCPVLLCYSVLAHLVVPFAFPSLDKSRPVRSSLSFPLLPSHPPHTTFFSDLEARCARGCPHHFSRRRRDEERSCRRKRRRRKDSEAGEPCCSVARNLGSHWPVRREQ